MLTILGINMVPSPSNTRPFPVQSVHWWFYDLVEQEDHLRK